MSEWEFAQANREHQLAKVQHFSMTKQQENESVEFTITDKEFLTPKGPRWDFSRRRISRPIKVWLPTPR